jgi:hypothetical protein
MSTTLLVNRKELQQGLTILSKCLKRWRRKKGETNL